MIEGRIATEEDQKLGTAIFFVPNNRSAPYSFGRNLPVRARVIRGYETEGSIGVGQEVLVVQAEMVDGREIILGIVAGKDEGICALEDVELLT